MTITIPFTYNVEFIAKGKRKTFTDWFVGSADFDVLELKSADAVEVVTWPRVHTPFLLSEETDNRVDLGRNAVISIDGNFYIRLASNRGIGTASVTAASLRADAIATLPSRDRLELSLILGRLDGPKPSEALRKLHDQIYNLVDGSIGAFAIDQVVRSEFDDAKAHIASKVDCFAMIDGILWRRISEPVIALSTDRDNRHLDLHVDGSAYGTTISEINGIAATSPTKLMLFSSVDFDKALETAEQLGTKPPWGTPSYRADAPHLLTFDRWTDAVSRTSLFAAESVASAIGKMEGPAISAWLEIREANDLFKTSHDVSILDAVIGDAIPRLLSSSGRAVATAILDEIEECLHLCDELKPSAQSIEIAKFHP